MFNWAVIHLVALAEYLNISYEEINVWLFMIVWPISTVFLIWKGYIQKNGG